MKKLSLVAGAIVLCFSASSFAAVTESCDKYFKTIDTYLDGIAKNDAMKSQLDMVKKQYNDSKEQMGKLPEDTQAQACGQAQSALEAAMKASGIN